MKNLIFLDIDGVLNCQLHYDSKDFMDYRDAKKKLKKSVKDEEIDRMEFYAHQICKKRISMLNNLCSKTDSAVVVSSTWRSNKTIEELQAIFDYCGATFKVIDKTGHSESRIRGVEIYEWLKEKLETFFNDVKYYDFKKYVIIDDDGDMLLWQAQHFFQTDNYAGLTPTICYKIERFFRGYT